MYCQLYLRRIIDQDCKRMLIFLRKGREMSILEFFNVSANSVIYSCPSSFWGSPAQTCGVRSGRHGILSSL